jgi:outer membrane protein OmpA-like peptidoglycan-associated protein
MKSIVMIAMCLSVGAASAQSQQQTGVSDLISKSTQAIGYTVGGGGTKVAFKATELVPQASGEAQVEAKKGVTNVRAEVKALAQPGKLGTEILTYVLWAVTPDGRTSQLGEIQIDQNGNGKLEATSELQTFSLIVTAEPYFAVRRPSELVVLENQTEKGTKGKIFPVNSYQLMKRGQYEKLGNALGLSLDLKSIPLEMYEARNSVDIAKSRGADKYAPEIFVKAESSLKMAENALAGKKDKKEIITTARQTVQFSEDARTLTVQRQEEERIKNERDAAAAKAKSEAEAKAAQEAAVAKQRADEEAQRQAELAAAKQAQMKAEADAAATKAKAEADALKAKEEAAKAEVEKARLAAEQLRAQLLGQLNRILETKDTPRGLIVTMADVLFDTGKYDLRPPTREQLARLAGIILAHPGLNLAIEGHTDSTGSDELNQKLSEQRASTVRSFLVDQGLSNDAVTSKGFGKTMPVADNTTAAGRQQNRRVEIIVSGESIGVKLGN